MKLSKWLIGIMFMSLLFSAQAYAHPGRTDANGGHTCRTNCEKWGLSYGEYHYHNGGGGSSSNSSPKNNGSSNKCSAALTDVPAGSIPVKLPEFNVYVNNQLINNYIAKYPVFEYKDIAYFPMTWNYTQALGLETKWDPDVGFVIRKTDKKAAKLTQEYGTASANKMYAKYPEFNVYINDSWLDNSKEEYPLLVWNDVTFFPMTWKFAVDELGLTIKFENNTFYISK